MLGLATGQPEWLQAFKGRLLSEAQKKDFTHSAHSVKFIQYEAALRVYYYFSSKQRFPHSVFIPGGSGNPALVGGGQPPGADRRVGGLALCPGFFQVAGRTLRKPGKRGGSFSPLEFTGLADPSCSGLNRRYLGRNVRGWNTRFRNTDDALVYQPEWITNAFFQSLFTGLISKENQKRSFEWLLLQALPDGSRLGYNHPGREPFAGISYLGRPITER